MIDKDTIQKAVIVILLVMLLLAVYIPLKVILSSARIWEVGTDNDPGDTTGFYKTGSYKINTNTILESIDRKQTPVFLPDTTVFPNLNANRKFAWTQSDYEKVASALFEFVWKESLNGNWSIHKMFFDANCEDPVGFERASFVYYQLIFQQQELKYEARAVDISPIDGNVSWGSDTVFPRPILGANVIDFDKLKITADEALSIAEENGGKSGRESVQDKCDLYLLFDGDWKVVYASGANGLSILEVTIDPHTRRITTSR